MSQPQPAPNILTLHAVADLATPSHPALTPLPPFPSPDCPRPHTHLFLISLVNLAVNIPDHSLLDCLVCICPSLPAVVDSLLWIHLPFLTNLACLIDLWSFILTCPLLGSSLQTENSPAFKNTRGCVGGAGFFFLMFNEIWSRKSSLSNRSSVLAHQTPNHCTAVYNTLTQDCTTVESYHSSFVAVIAR